MCRWVTIVGSVLCAVALTAAVTVASAVAGPAVAATAQTSFTFTGGGWGHGVGMSQYGAKGRADAGQNLGQILDAYYPGAAVETRSPGGPRVKLGDAGSTEVSAGAGTLLGAVDGGPWGPIANPGERLALRAASGSITAQRVDIAGGPVTTLSSSGTGYNLSWAGSTLAVSATGRSYAYGQLRLIPNGGTFAMVLGNITMQQYLYGLGEMPASWSIEALRAQAVAGRSFATYRLAHPQDPSTFDLFASVSDQAYVGTTQTSGASGPNWTSAVDSTDGQVLVSGGSPIQAFYSSSNGGHTERSDYVFSATLPYLVATSDPFDQATGNPNFSWSRTYNGDELAAWFASAGRGSVGSVTAVSFGGNVGASGRVDRATVTVTGTTKTITMTGNQFRSAINAGAPSNRDLLSTKLAAGATATAAPAAAAPATPVAPPADTTAPDLKVLVGDPMRFGSTGNICAFVMSDEVAISAIHIRLGGVDLRSRVGGVGPTFPQFMCINIPPRLRPKRPTRVVLTGAALDVAVNMRFVQQTVTVAR